MDGEKPDLKIINDDNDNVSDITENVDQYKFIHNLIKTDRFVLFYLDENDLPCTTQGEFSCPMEYFIIGYLCQTWMADNVRDDVDYEEE